MAVIFLFVDGVGLGDKKPENPLIDPRLRAFEFMAGGPFIKEEKIIRTEDHLFKGIDACLGMDGLPQSGTGQAALFSGKNASKLAGRHFGPYPHSQTTHLLKEKSLFSRARSMEYQPHFLNAYPDLFFQKMGERNRWTCTTMMARQAGLRLNTEADVKQQKALTAEITQQAWRDQLLIDVPEITPEEAARRTLKAAEQYDLLLFEYYLTDKTGHARDSEMAQQVLRIYDRFLLALIRNKAIEDTLVLSSDHGNIEDLSIRTHTRNNVPLFVYGPGAPHFISAESIMDVAGGILEALKND